MGIFDGHIVRFSGGFCQTSFALRTTVFCTFTIKYFFFSENIKTLEEMYSDEEYVEVFSS